MCVAGTCESPEKRRNRAGIDCHPMAHSRNGVGPKLRKAALSGFPRGGEISSLPLVETRRTPPTEADAERLFLEALDRRLQRKNQRLWRNLEAWAELLDVLGWSVAYPTEAGSVFYSPRARAQFAGEGGEPLHFEALVAYLDGCRPAARPVNTDGLQIWVSSLSEVPALFPSTPLTEREAEVLHWLREGKTAAETGTILGCAPRTVESHTARIYRKFGVRKRIELLAHPVSEPDRATG